MNYYSAEQLNIDKGIYKGFENGYFLFELDKEIIINFEEISKNILEEFDLKSKLYLNKKFEINYKEIFDDLDDEDFIIYRLESLKLLAL